MPSLQQPSNFKDCSITDLNGSDILQKRSINSLLEQNEKILQNDVETNSYKDIFCNLPTPVKGSLQTMFNSHNVNNNLNQSPSLQSKNSFDNFQVDNFSSQQNLGFDCIMSPTTPSTPGSSKAFHAFPQIGSDSSVSRSSLESSFLNSLSRSNSPLINDNLDIALPTNDAQNLSDFMSILHLNQANQQQQLDNQYQRENIQLQALQLQLYQQQQLNQQYNLMPIQQLFKQQIINQVQQMQQNIRPSQESHGIMLDQAAKYYRSSASLRDATCTWSGVLPCRSHKFISYSPKVFLGGIPWDISEQTLMQILKPFGQIRIEWPGKEHNAAQPKGYVYVIFESERQVKALLQACSIQDSSVCTSSSEDSSSSIAVSENYYYKISSKRIREKEVEVIPWIIEDSNYIRSANQKLDSTKTVFVGALHGKLTAEALAKIMNDLFDGVVYAGIDTDKHKYPIGSGRVTFNNTRSYMRAVSAAFIEIKTSKFTKKVQVDPYLEDALCSLCGVQHGPYYCRELACFRYFCRQCWQIRHLTDAYLRNHKPLTRNSKTQTIVGIGPQTSSGSSPVSSFHNSNNNQRFSNIKMSSGMKNSLAGYGGK